MKCQYPSREIALFVEGDVSEGDRRRVERHLVVCETCRSFTEALRESQSELKTLRQGTVGLSALRNVRERVLAEIEATEASLGWALRLERAIYLSPWRRYALAGAAAVLVLALVSGIMWELAGNPLTFVRPREMRAVSLPDIEDIRLTSLAALSEETAPPPRPVLPDMPTLAPAARALHVERLALDAPVMAWEDLPLMAPSPLPLATVNVSPLVEPPGADEPDQVLVKMLTQDPDIVVYWVVDPDSAMGPDGPNEGGV